MALAAPSNDFIGAIRTALVDAGMLRDTIIVIDPQTESTTEYDPETDTGGVASPTVVIGPRAAYIKAEAGAEALTEAGILQGKIRYRVQFIPQDGDPIVTKGMVVRVLPGGQNSALPRVALAVLAAPSGSIAALTKVECQASGALAPIWEG